MRAALVYNPVKIDVDEVRSVVAQHERDAGWSETLWLETSQEDPGQGMAREALEAGVAVVIAAGGDGTVRAVAEGLRGSGTPLALLPSGTGNLLARNLGIPLDDVSAAIATALTGADRAIDAAVMTIRREDGASSKHVFVVMAGMGLDAQMLVETDDDLKKRAGWLAYVAASWKVLRHTDDLHASLKLDEASPSRVRAHTIMIGNCGTLQGNFLLLPDAAIDDGILDLVVLAPNGSLGWFQALGRLIWQNGILRHTRWGKAFEPAETEALTYSTAKRLELRLRSPQEVELDGDPFGEAIGIRVVVDAGALVVRVTAAA